MLYFVSGRERPLAALMQRASTRVQKALRPKTSRCYDLLFRNFIGFCVCNTVNIFSISTDEVMAYMEYLVENGVSVTWCQIISRPSGPNLSCMAFLMTFYTTLVLLTSQNL